MRNFTLTGPSLLVLFSATWTSTSHASPPVPTGSHPRLFMSAAELAGYTANAGVSGTAAASLVKACEDTLSEPNSYTTRGGSDGDNWPGSAMRCAFAYLATKQDKYRTQALKYWHASLDDDQNIGDGLGCVVGADSNWQSWDGSSPAPPIILTVTHDTGYSMRWYAPDIALSYDWLNQTQGVDAALLSQTRTCLTAWIDWYSASGYHHDEPGANYNAGFVIGKTLGGIAIGNDGGADGHVWKETTDDLFPNLLVGQGLLGASGAVGMPAGVMVGGDWAEGWEYGPLSVLEYAVAARALQENGAMQPEMSAWTDSLAIRYIYGTLPDRKGQWVGGDFDDVEVYTPPNVNELDAVLAGLSSDTSAAFAASMKQTQAPDPGTYFYNALAELRDVKRVDFTKQNPAPSRWYVARGTRALYARSSWATDALWAVFSSSPANVSDHIHFSASNVVLTRGSDHLLVDPSNYGEPDTLASNAVTADSTVAQGDYHMTQTPWSEAELVWARGTDDAVYAARSDFAKAFIFSDTPSDIPYAHREWVLLPEGEVVTIDRVHTKDATHPMVVGFHTNTGGGGLSLSGSVASGAVGGSKVAIHAVSLSGGRPGISQPMVGDCKVSCSYPCGACDAARFAVDKYAVTVPGPFAVAIHVIDALDASEKEAQVESMNDDAIDPSQKDNSDVIGAGVFRSTKQTYVVASSAMDGASPQTMRYGIPGAGPSRHVVFDAPEDAKGASKVTGAASGGRCLISITAGDGFPGQPLMFTVSSAAEGCKVTSATDVGPGKPPGSGSGGSSGSSSSGAGGAGGHHGSGTSGSSTGGSGQGGGDGEGDTADKGGCGCRVGDLPTNGAGALATLAVIALARKRRRSSWGSSKRRDESSKEDYDPSS